MSDYPPEPDEALAETDLVAPKARSGWALVVVLESGPIERSLEAPCELVLGRAAGVDVTVDHASVSRQHARIVLREAATIEDLGSSNGTRVDGRRLDRGQVAYVHAGSVVELGDVLLLLRPPQLDLAGGAERGSGVGSEMARAFELATAAGRSSLNVYVSGEAGSGRRWLASRIREASPRAATTWLAFDCAGASAAAVSGTSEALPGILEQAAGGMLLIHDVHLLETPAQRALQVALANRSASRLDGSVSVALDLRIIATSTVTAKELRANPAFDTSLASQLAGIAIEIPPLRRRRGEIRHLAETSLREAPRRGLVLSDGALGRLLLDEWPGNVALLRDVVLRAASTARTNEIRAEDIVFPDADGVPVESAADKERARLVIALELCAGNQTKAAEMLGISRRTLVNRLNQLDLPRPRKGA